MNGRQRTVLIACAIVVIALLLIPPWRSVLDGGRGGRSLYYGYHFVLKPPSHNPRIDYPRFIGPIAAVCVMAYLAIRELGGGNREREPR